MKTIEERSSEAADIAYPYIGGMKGMICDNDKTHFKNGYIVGASEQKKIDIEKACEYARKTYGDKWFNKEREEDFRKFMEV